MKTSFISSLLILAGSLCAVAAPGLAVQQDAHGVQITVDGKPFATYVIDQANKPYLWPIYGPTGKSMSRAYPMEEVPGENKEQRDHPHHRGILFGHESIGGGAWAFPKSFQGLNQVDNRGGADTWHEQVTFELMKKNPKDEKMGEQRLLLLGKIQHQKFTEVKVTGNQAVVAELCEYLDGTGKRFLTEERRMTFRADGETRSIDFDQEFIASDGEVRFEDRKDGGLSIRVPSSMAVDSKQGGQIVTSEGDQDGGAWGKAAKWCDYYGPVEGEQLGIAFLNHPSSYRFPTRWHVRSYGLFTANPFASKQYDKNLPDGLTELKAGERLKLRHRMIFHKGNPTSAQIEQAFEAYAKETK